MTKICPPIIGLLVIWLTAGPVAAAPLPKPTVDYAADFILTVSNQQGQEPMRIPGKVYYSEGKERRESEVMGRKSISIRDDRDGSFYVLMPDQRMYLESTGSNSKKQRDPSAALLDGDFKLEQLGTEMVNGISADKYRFSSVDAKGNQTSGHLWFSKEQIPVKMEGTTRQQGRISQFKSELTRVEVGSQPASLFRIPSDYSKLQTPSMIGGMGNLPGNSTMLPDGPSGAAGTGMGMSPEDLKKLQQQLEQFKQQMQQQ